MAIVPFYTVAGKRAADETRSITIMDDERLPADSYGFMEFYCNDPKCDCRRVIFQVWRPGTGCKPWATITYGWEPAEYYAKWGHMGPGAMANEVAGAALEQISPQTELSRDLLRLCKEMLLTDAAYVARLKRHYEEMCAGRGGAPWRERKPSGKVQRRLSKRAR